MIDIKLLRENPEMVKLNGDNLREQRKTLSNKIGNLMKTGQKEEAEKIKIQVNEINKQLEENEKLENTYNKEIETRMMKIPNIIDKSVPIRKR